jgi:glycosyltransferase involved in cell wall biosynthesis
MTQAPNNLPSENPEVSIVVPAINESENFPELLRRIDAAMKSILPATTYEVLIVDDNSADNTPAVCADLAKQYPLRLLVRTRPKNGLSGAVLHGLAEARGKYFVVMDADLQHPPDRLPALLQPLRDGSADFVVGSRYMPGGSTETEWGFLRKINSRVATYLARPFAAFVLERPRLYPVRAATLAYGWSIFVTAVFYIRYIRTQREFILRKHPWLDFALISAIEWLACFLTAEWTADRLAQPTLLESFAIPFAVATLTRYVLRKEFLQDIRGLRKSLPREADAAN